MGTEAGAGAAGSSGAGAANGSGAAGAGQGGQGAGGQGAAGTGGGTGAGQGAGTQPQWFDSFNDDLKGYVQTKGWKEPSQAVESYRNFEKIQGVPQDRILRLPDKADDPSWKDVHYRLGVPKEAKDYQFDIPKEIGDENFAKTAREWFHKNNVPKGAAEAIVKEWNAHQMAQNQALLASKQTTFAKEEGELKSGWGAAFEQNVKAGQETVKAFGITKEEIDGLQASIGFKRTMELMHSLSRKIGEHEFVPSNNESGGAGRVMTPSEARYRIDQLKKDGDFRSRLINKDSKATEEWNQLNRWASA